MAQVLRLVLASALLMTALPASAKAPPLPGPDELFHFTGTEPFWAGTVRRAKMVFMTPDNERGERIRVRRSAAPGQIVYQGRMVRDGRFTMTIIASECGDGMSDISYPYDVTIAFGSRRIMGCGWTAHHRYKPGE